MLQDLLPLQCRPEEGQVWFFIYLISDQNCFNPKHSNVGLQILCTIFFTFHMELTRRIFFSNQELLQLKFNFIFSKNLSGEIHQIETSWVSWQHSGNSLKMKRKECSSKWIILRLWYDLLSFFFSLSNLKYTCMCHTVVCTILKLSLCWKPLYL